MLHMNFKFLPRIYDSSYSDTENYILGYSLKWFIVLIWAIPWSVFMGIFNDFSSFYWGIMQYYYVILCVFIIANKDYYFLSLTYIVTGVSYLLSLNSHWISSSYAGFYKRMSWGILNILFALFMIIMWNLKPYSELFKNHKKRQLPITFINQVWRNILKFIGILSCVCLLFVIFIFIAKRPISDKAEYDVTFSNKSIEEAVRNELKIDASKQIMRSDLDKFVAISIPNSNNIKFGTEYTLDTSKWNDDKLIFSFTSLISCEGNNHEIKDDITNLKDIRHFRKLKYLELVGDDNLILYHLDDLQCLTSLETLKLTTNKYIQKVDTNLNALNKLKTLKCLYLDVPHVKNFKCISKLSKLEILRFHSEDGLDNINDIKQLKKMKYLSISNSQLEDITPIKNLDKLTYLSLFKNNISDLSPIKDISTLQDIDFRYNQISDISALSKLTELRYVVLLENGDIKDISALKDANKLKYLWIKTTDTKNLELLSGKKGVSIYTDSTD